MSRAPLSQADLARLMKPTGEAGGLPRAAYVDRDFLAAENERLFARRWVCVGLVEDVAEPGSVRPVTAAGRSLILLRDLDGTIRVFHNFCRHRGMRLIDEAATGQRAILCRYHSWSYGLDGALLKTPHVAGIDRHDRAGLPRELPGLAPVRFALWGPLVFVDLSGAAPPFETYIAPLARRWKDYDFSVLKRGESLRYEIACNWKLAIENFIDIYHVPYVHPGLNGYCAMKDHYLVADNDVFMGQGLEAYAPEDAAAGALPSFPGLGPKAISRMEAFGVFPNLCMTLFHDNLRIILVEPDGPARCTERVEVFLVDSAATDPALAAMRKTLVDRFREFNAEDIGILEALQRSFETTAWDGGAFTPVLDAMVHRFQRLIATALTEDGAA
ncbi:MAG: aromatic ring-hydroxylating dioxygenase subunit alpha [Alphaproteobacteria bacterium]